MTQSAKDRSQESRESAHEEKFRRWFSWVVLVACTTWGIIAAVWLAYHAWRPESWVIPILREHFAALVGIPMSALIAMCVVILLRFSAGPIEFKGLGFEFRGASGQVVFWIFCFLAIVSGLKLLW
jgi:hypothetical protein